MIEFMRILDTARGGGTNHEENKAGLKADVLWLGRWKQPQLGDVGKGGEGALQR